MCFVFVRFFLLRLRSVRVPISAPRPTRPRPCLYEFRVPIPFFYAIFLSLFAMFVIVTFSVYIPFFAIAACLRPCPEPFGCDCALLTSLPHHIAC